MNEVDQTSEEAQEELLRLEQIYGELRARAADLMPPALSAAIWADTLATMDIKGTAVSVLFVGSSPPSCPCSSVELRITVNTPHNLAQPDLGLFDQYLSMRAAVAPRNRTADFWQFALRGRRSGLLAGGRLYGNWLSVFASFTRQNSKRETKA